MTALSEAACCPLPTGPLRTEHRPCASAHQAQTANCASLKHQPARTNYRLAPLHQAMDPHRLHTARQPFGRTLALYALLVCRHSHGRFWMRRRRCGCSGCGGSPRPGLLGCARCRGTVGARARVSSRCSGLGLGCLEFGRVDLWGPRVGEGGW